MSTAVPWAACVLPAGSVLTPSSAGVVVEELRDDGALREAGARG